MKKHLLISVMAALALLLVAIPVYAFDSPDSVSIDGDKTLSLRNLAETGDIAIIFRFSMPYAGGYPDVAASNFVVFKLLADDGTTLLQTSAPYVYSFFDNNGFGEGTGAFYFGAGDANIPTWGDAVKISISVLSSPAASGEYTLTASNWETSTTQAGNREALMNFIFLDCDRLEAAYSATDIVMKSTSDIGVVLSPYGEMYYRGVIDGLQTLCPDLFFVQSLVPESLSSVSYNMSRQDVYTGRLVGEDMGKGFERLGDFIGVGGAFAAAAVTFCLCMGFCLWTTKKGWGVEIGMAGSALIVIGLALIVGDIVFTVMMVLSLVAAMLLSWVLLIKRG